MTKKTSRFKGALIHQPVVWRVSLLQVRMPRLQLQDDTGAMLQLGWSHNTSLVGQLAPF